jgi:hypothetical protein
LREQHVDERLRRQRRELVREMLDEHAIGAGGVQQLCAAGLQRDHGFLRISKRGARMRIERQHARRQAVGARERIGCPQQRSMPEVYAIVVAR